jgi:hypothetical protein
MASIASKSNPLHNYITKGEAKIGNDTISLPKNFERANVSADLEKLGVQGMSNTVLTEVVRRAMSGGELKLGEIQDLAEKGFKLKDGTEITGKQVEDVLVDYAFELTLMGDHKGSELKADRAATDFIGGRYGDDYFNEDD